MKFSVAIFEVDVPQLDRDQRKRIASHLVRRCKAEQAQARSNRGGWRSEDLCEDEQLRWLIDRVVAMSELSLRGSRDLDPGSSLALNSCWASVNQSGDWHLPHTHYGCDWSVVVYINVPASAVNGDDGEIIFIDPLGRRHGYDSMSMIVPKDAIMLLFPAYLVHMVAPHTSMDRRITVSFNLDVVQ